MTMKMMTTMYGTMCRSLSSGARSSRPEILYFVCVSRDTHKYSQIQMESQSNTAASQPAMNFLASAQAGEAEKVPLREIQVRFGFDSKGKWLDDGVGGLGCRRARRRSGEHEHEGE